MMTKKYFEDDENKFKIFIEKFNKIKLECKYMNSFVNDKDQFKNDRINFKLDYRKKKLQEAILNKNKHLLNYHNILFKGFVSLFGFSWESLILFVSFDFMDNPGVSC